MRHTSIKKGKIKQLIKKKSKRINYNNENKLNNYYSSGGGIFRNTVEQYRESKRFLSNFNQ